VGGWVCVCVCVCASVIFCIVTLKNFFHQRYLPSSAINCRSNRITHLSKEGLIDGGKCRKPWPVLSLPSRRKDVFVKEYGQWLGIARAFDLCFIINAQRGSNAGA
jgi:hypothetical protein